MPRVRILLEGLTDSGRIYRAGDVVDAPTPRLLELAGGETLRGQLVAEVVDDARPTPRKKK